MLILRDRYDEAVARLAELRRHPQVTAADVNRINQVLLGQVGVRDQVEATLPSHTPCRQQSSP